MDRKKFDRAQEIEKEKAAIKSHLGQLKKMYNKSSLSKVTFSDGSNDSFVITGIYSALIEDAAIHALEKEIMRLDIEFDKL